MHGHSCPHSRCKVRQTELTSYCPRENLLKSCACLSVGYKCGLYSALTSGKEWRKGTKRNTAANNKCLSALLIVVALNVARWSVDR